MLPKKRIKAKTEGFRSVALMCLGMALLLAVFPPPEAPSLAIETAARSEGPIHLTQGSSVRREIAAGVNEVFEISVEKDQLLRFSIDKGDLALSAVLHGPTGAKLLEYISQEFEVVELFFPVDLAGPYRLEVKSLEKTETRRQYELQVHSLTTVTATERRDSEARLAVAQAEVLRAAWTQASLKQALEKYEQAAQIWTAMRDYPNASHASLRAGDVYFLLSDYDEALNQYQKAETSAAQASDDLNEGRALSRMGRIYSYLGKNGLAQARLAKALNLLEHGEAAATGMGRNAYGEALSNLGEVSYARGNLDKALVQFETARKAFHDDRKGRAKTHLFAGYIKGSLGGPDKATLEISSALELYREINNKSGEGLALTALGIAHSWKDKNAAIKLHRSALEIFGPIGDRHGEAVALTGLGQAYENLSEHAIALENYKSAVQILLDSGALDLAPVATFRVARLYRSLGNLEQSLAYYKLGLRLARSARKVRTEINALNEMASVYVSLGRPEQILHQYQRIQEFYQSIGDLRGQATALNTLGDFLHTLGQREKALESYRRAFALSEKIGDKGLLLATLYNLARANRELGHSEVALSFIKQSLNAIEDSRSNVGSPDLRASYFAGVRKHHDLCIDILMQLERERPGEGFAAEALLMSEKARARSLLDLLSESRVDFRQGAAPELLERERELRGLLRSLAQYEMELSPTDQDNGEAAEVAARMAQLRAEYQELQAQLRAPRQLSLAQSAPATLAQIQNELQGSDTMLLEFALGDERSYLWAVTSNSFQSYELPARKVLEEAAAEVYGLMTARQRIDGAAGGSYQANVEAADNLYFEKANHLSQMLLGQVAEQLESRRLLVVTEGALQHLSFDALPRPSALSGGPGPFLVETNEIVVVPSISTLRAIRSYESKRGSASRIVAVIADPVFSRSDDRVQNGGRSPAIVKTVLEQNPRTSGSRGLEIFQRNSNRARLPHASEEADAISAAAPRGTSLVVKGFDASRETVMSSRVGQYQIVHFATHGFLDSAHPELSGIVLSMVDRNGAEQNGVMPLHDIYNLDLSAELTVLSACQTALGKDIKGEGLVGLTHSFFSAGSKSVVASLWKVDDRATAILMADFYESMLQQGMPPATALRAAKLKMMKGKQWNAPYFWAGFVLQGEYTNRIVVDENSWFRTGLVLLSALALISSGLIVLQRRRRRSVP